MGSSSDSGSGSSSSSSSSSDSDRRRKPSKKRGDEKRGGDGDGARTREDDGRDGAARSAGRDNDSNKRRRGRDSSPPPPPRRRDARDDIKGKGRESQDAQAKEREPRKPLVAGKAGGAYIPPFKLAQMMAEQADKTGPEYQRMTWDALKKSINGLVNKVNASNVKNILPELFAENMIRGRGLFARSVMKSQMASPQFSGVFAALVAVVNTKFPEIGELIAKRCVLQFRRAYKRNDKPVCVAATRFLAALINQQVRCSMDDAMRRDARDATEDEL